MKRKCLVVDLNSYPNYFQGIDKVSTTVENNFNNICYLSSDKNDPGLELTRRNVATFCIGEGIVRSMLLNTLEAKEVAIKVLLGKFKSYSDIVKYLEARPHLGLSP